MSAGVACVIFGQALFYGASTVAIYGGVVLVLFTLFVFFCEEPVLKRRFGAQYDEYCAKVPRWILRRPRR
jgi:protein-S-isoprenylcysteine O-methyltransferase Ste14